MSIARSFLKACFEGDLETVKALIDDDFYIFCFNQQASWRLFSYLCPKNLHVIKFLFPQHYSFDHHITGDDVEEVDEYTFVDTVPICIAMKYCDDDNHEILDYFLDNGADIESDITIRSRYYPTDTTFSLVQYAITLGRAKTVRYLVSRGASLEGCSIMFIVRWACFNNSVDLLQFAIEQGAKFKDRPYLPLHWCMINPGFLLYYSDIQKSILTSLLFYAPGIKVNMTDFAEITNHKIGKFCPDNLLEMVKILLECGLDPNKQEPKRGLTAGHMVCRGDKVEQYRLLLAHGWDINRKDRHEWTALHYAVFGNDPSAVKYLIENGAEVNIIRPNYDGYNRPLHSVALKEDHVYAFERLGNLWHRQDREMFKSSKCEIIAYLISKGADVNALDDYGDTLAEMMCGNEVLYETLSWLMENTNSKVPYNGQYSDLPEEMKRNSKFVYTDCLIPAGFQCKEFIKKHMEIVLEYEIMPLYRACMYANPQSMYDIQPEEFLQDTVVDLYFSLRQLYEKEHPHCPVKELFISVMQKGNFQSASSVSVDYLMSVTEPPELQQLAMFSVRQQLLQCNNNMSLFPLIYKLPIPVGLKELLCLKTVNNYTTQWDTEPKLKLGWERF